VHEKPARDAGAGDTRKKNPTMNLHEQMLAANGPVQEKSDEQRGSQVIARKKNPTSDARAGERVQEKFDDKPHDLMLTADGRCKRNPTSNAGAV